MIRKDRLGPLVFERMESHNLITIHNAPYGCDGMPMGNMIPAIYDEIGLGKRR